jgi:hypothetical protein
MEFLGTFGAQKLHKKDFPALEGGGRGWVKGACPPLNPFRDARQRTRRGEWGWGDRYLMFMPIAFGTEMTTGVDRLAAVGASGPTAVGYFQSPAAYGEEL